MRSSPGLWHSAVAHHLVKERGRDAHIVGRQIENIRVRPIFQRVSQQRSANPGLAIPKAYKSSGKHWPGTTPVVPDPMASHHRGGRTGRLGKLPRSRASLPNRRHGRFPSGRRVRHSVGPQFFPRQGTGRRPLHYFPVRPPIPTSFPHEAPLWRLVLPSSSGGFGRPFLWLEQAAERGVPRLTASHLAVRAAGNSRPSA
jgi:hypothetical protein